MNYQIGIVTQDDKDTLAQLRVMAMKESLETIGRFDPIRARSRFLEKFVCEDTKKILINSELAGFYVVKINHDHLNLDHLYISPKYQGLGLGGQVLSSIIKLAQARALPVRLGALKKSRSNYFYRKHGFSYTHEHEWDNYYEFSHG